VVEQNKQRYYPDVDDSVFKRQLSINHQIVDELRQLGEARNVQTTTSVKVGPDPETVILDYAKRYRVDLIILGTDVRSGSDRLFLGPRVERILKHTTCPVVIMNSIT
jgi:nucleotide-binding universal stress UspA family protein